MGIFEWSLFYFLEHITNIELGGQHNQESIKRRTNINQKNYEDIMAGNLSKMMKPTNPQEAWGISSKENNGNREMVTLRIPKYREISFT